MILILPFHLHHNQSLSRRPARPLSCSCEFCIDFIFSCNILLPIDYLPFVYVNDTSEWKRTMKCCDSHQMSFDNNMNQLHEKPLANLLRQQISEDIKHDSRCCRLAAVYKMCIGEIEISFSMAITTFPSEERKRKKEGRNGWLPLLLRPLCEWEWHR